MIGRAKLLDIDVPLPVGVTLRQVRNADDVRAMAAMQDSVFETTSADETARALLRRLALDDGMELWVAELKGEIIAAGRLELVAGTHFAGIWGEPPSQRGAGKESTALLPLHGPGQR